MEGQPHGFLFWVPATWHFNIFYIYILHIHFIRDIKMSLRPAVYCLVSNCTLCHKNICKYKKILINRKIFTSRTLETGILAREANVKWKSRQKREDILQRQQRNSTDFFYNQKRGDHCRMFPIFS